MSNSPFCKARYDASIDSLYNTPWDKKKLCGFVQQRLLSSSGGTNGPKMLGQSHKSRQKQCEDAPNFKTETSVTLDSTQYPQLS